LKDATEHLQLATLEPNQQVATPLDSIESTDNGSRQQPEAAAHSPAETNTTIDPGAPAPTSTRDPSQQAAVPYESALRQQQRPSATAYARPSTLSDNNSNTSSFKKRRRQNDEASNNPRRRATWPWRPTQENLHSVLKMSTNVEDWTAEEFRKYVQKAIQQLREGFLFMICGLSNSDAIIEDGSGPPSSKDKNHPFNMLLDCVAADIVKELSLTEKKKAKKSILKQLQKYNQVWVEMILNTNPSTQSNVEEEQNETMEEEAVETEGSEDEGEPDPPVRMPPLKKLQARKAFFEKERDEILSDIPDSVQDRFGQIFFTKWGTNFMPCLAVSPFSVPPGPVRYEMYEMYEKVLEVLRGVKDKTRVRLVTGNADPKCRLELSEIVVYHLSSR
jgi:hypothetical protein